MFQPYLSFFIRRPMNIIKIKKQEGNNEEIYYGRFFGK